jgi:hypothetical protein
MVVLWVTSLVQFGKVCRNLKNVEREQGNSGASGPLVHAKVTNKSDFVKRGTRSVDGMSRAAATGVPYEELRNPMTPGQRLYP